MPKQSAKTSKKGIASKNTVSFLFVALGVILLLFLTTFNLEHFLSKQKVLGSTTEISSSRNEIAFWENFLAENENYLEGWYELTKLKLNEGDIAGSNNALIEIEKINPNSEWLVKLKKLP